MKRITILALPVLAAFGGCLSVTTQSKVEPIHIVVDVNVKVEEALQKFFKDIDQKAVKP